MTPEVRKTLGAFTAAAAILMLLVAAQRTHKVYDKGAPRFGLVKFHTVSETQLVIDATFGGVVLGDRLYSTYDRTQTGSRGKRSCPT